MFPFKSHPFRYISPLPIQRLKERIDTALIVPDTWTADHTNVWRGKRIDNTVTMEKWFKSHNSHQPVIKAILEERKLNETEITGYYTIAKPTIIATVSILCFLVGFCTYYQIFAALIIVFTFACILFVGVGYIFFQIHYNRTKKAFERLIGIE